MNPKQGEIYLVDFEPSMGSEYQKMRPALIIENNFYIPKSNIITLLPITSQIEKAMSLDVIIPKDVGNKLIKDSIIKIQYISTFDKIRLIKHIGICSSEILTKVFTNLATYLKYSTI